MRVYPSILLQKGDLVESPNEKMLWYVADIIDWIPMLCDGTHIFCPRWGFYFQTDYWSFIPIVDNSSASKINEAYFDFDYESTWGFSE